MCKFCSKQITELDQESGNATMIQSTECWHRCHIDCLKEAAIKCMSENEDVKCQRCDGKVMEYELKEYLSVEELKQIEQQ